MRSTTDAERAAFTWEAECIDFDWTNEEWALCHLPMVRLATIVMNRDHNELQETVGQLASEGLAPELLEHMTTTKKHLAALVDLLDRALVRQFLVLERLGYSPDNPPPDKSLN